MPAPDPHGITIEERPHGWGVLVETFMLSGRAQRMARARGILRNLAANRWACRWCGGPVPEFRRADACYCVEGCRKRAAPVPPEGKGAGCISRRRRARDGLLGRTPWTPRKAA